MSFYRMAVQRPPSIGASDNAPFVSRPQGSPQHELRAQHCDATRCAKHQSREQTPLKKAMLFCVETNDRAKVAASSKNNACDSITLCAAAVATAGARLDCRRHSPPQICGMKGRHLL
jgi:hypothetical protein